MCSRLSSLHSMHTKRIDYRLDIRERAVTGRDQWSGLSAVSVRWAERLSDRFVWSDGCPTVARSGQRG